MRFIADINITQTVISSLRQNNHDVLDLKKINLEIPDIEIIKLAQKDNRIILTHDKDFESLVRYPKYQVGIILIRLKDQHSRHHFEKLNQLLGSRTEEILRASLTIVEEDTIRILPY